MEQSRLRHASQGSIMSKGYKLWVPLLHKGTVDQWLHR